MQFSRKIGQLIGWRPSLGNPGSATVKIALLLTQNLTATSTMVIFELRIFTWIYLILLPTTDGKVMFSELSVRLSTGGERGRIHHIQVLSWGYGHSVCTVTPPPVRGRYCLVMLMRHCFVTARIRRMAEGNIFTLCVSPHLDWGGYPIPGLDGEGVPHPRSSPSRPGMGYPPSIQDWMRSPPPIQDWMEYPLTPFGDRAA